MVKSYKYILIWFALTYVQFMFCFDFLLQFPAVQFIIAEILIRFFKEFGVEGFSKIWIHSEIGYNFILYVLVTVVPI